jgi:hypothetical protein
VTGDQAYSVLELGLTCRLSAIRLVAPLRLDARLFQPPPKPVAKQVGRPRVIGARLPKLSEVLKASDTDWQMIRVRWYDRCWRDLRIATGTAVWYRCGHAPLPLRWMLVRDPKGQLQPRAYFSTILDDTPESILTTAIQRWTIGVSGEGHIIQSVKVRPRPKDSGLVAWEAPRRESKAVKPSDPYTLGVPQRTR